MPKSFEAKGKKGKKVIPFRLLNYGNYYLLAFDE